MKWVLLAALLSTISFSTGQVEESPLMKKLRERTKRGTETDCNDLHYFLIYFGAIQTLIHI